MARVMAAAPSPALLTALATLALACGPAPPDVRVVWQERVQVEVGAEVRYQGVPIGEVTDVSLLQPESSEPARVEVALRIDDPDVTLRQDDTFEIISGGLTGASYVAITPASDASQPLPPGARVNGTPALVTRMRESVDAVVDSLEELAREKADALLESWTRAGKPRPPDQSAPTPSPPGARP